MNERDIAQQVTAGEDAARVLDSPAFKEAMKQLREEIFAEWRKCPIRDREGQVLLKQLAGVQEKFEALLGGAVQTGKLAKVKLDDLRDESRARNYMRRIL